MYILVGRRLGEAASCSTITNCSAISVDRFEKQPPELRRVLTDSFRNPAEWFTNLDREKRMALTSIYNRLCAYRLWCHVRTVLKVAPGQPPVILADRVFKVPGRTPSVYFMSFSGDALIKALMGSGKFCMARGIGASRHPGQTTIREISGSDSLHVSVGPGDQFDAHIDKFSPVTERSGSSFCSNLPTAAAVRHIGRELVPEDSPIPGVQVFPEPPPQGPRPELTRRQEPDLQPPIVGITWHGPSKRERPRAPSPAGPRLSAESVARIERAIKQQVARDALLPSHVRVRRAKARWAAETAGPNEEDRLRRLRDAAEQEAESYPDAQLLALDLAERMEQARRSGARWVKIDLPQYDARDFPSRKAIAAQIRRMGLILRNYLPDRAQNVGTIVIMFGTGNSATRQEVQL
jgi:hypothetical protein